MNQVRLLLSLCFAFSACACISTSARRPRTAAELRQQLEAETLFTAARVAELAALEPRLELPFVLGIAPPLDLAAKRSLKSPFAGKYVSSDRAGGSIGFDEWTSTEREILDKKIAELVSAGVLTRAVYLPTSLARLEDEQGKSGPALCRSLREAGARAHADAVLVIHRAGDVHVSSNLTAFLDLSILGYYVVPGYTVKVRSVVEAYVVDTYNEYLYATDQASADAKRTTPGAYVKQKAHELDEQARGQALGALVTQLVFQGPWSDSLRVQ